MVHFIPFLTLWVQLNFGAPNWYSMAPIEKSARLDFFSEQLLDVDYQLNPLGEDVFDSLDQDPLVRFDQFDCLTYVETIIALAKSKDWNDFLQLLIGLRYQNGLISFETRHHFVEGTWIESAQQNGILQDVTDEVVTEDFRVATAQIDVEKWKQKLNPMSLGYSVFDDDFRRRKLRSEISPLLDVQLKYIPKENLFPNPELLEKIPNGSIIFFLVRPSSKTKALIGTSFLVSHVGLVLKRNGHVIIRHASSYSRSKRVVEDPLSDLLRDNSRLPSLIGINIQKLRLELN